MQLNAAMVECESFDIARPNFMKLIALCKHETYRNNDRCFRIFLLATKILSDRNAMKMFSVFYNSQMFTQLSDFYICWAQRCDQNHSIIRAILIKALRMDAKPKCSIEIRKRSISFVILAMKCDAIWRGKFAMFAKKARESELEKTKIENDITENES
uniref:Uncharacterized protein n=1 Tax=Onchocerca volvulus TaxID=6282 RepID=A0A8R1XTW0_ONCVO